MTQTQQHCSTPNQLLTFLRGQLSVQEESELQLHLNDCVLCRERLDNAAADADSWNEARQFFGSEALKASADDSNGDHEEATQGSQRIRQVLDTLGPTDDPESLGRIGGYEVTGVVGAGGMGVVLKAHDRSLDRIVAIKVMSPHLASSGSARKRFAREAKAAAAVLHPNVIAIHSVSSEVASPFLVMPYVRGSSLQKRIDSQGPLPLKDTLRIGTQIAAGLAAAHEQGLVHRDIKPANILLEEGVERVTITDFGLARAVDDASMTCSGVIAGTPQYMSPEQTRGEPIDARSDLFSLGSVLYAMCAGRSPFRAETTYGVLHRIANGSPTPVCEVNSDVPVWLGHIIERLMAKRPDDRFESATQVAELLEGCLAHVQQPVAMPLPVGVQALAAQSQPRARTVPESKEKNRLKAIHQQIPPISKLIAAAAFAFSLIFAGVLIVLELDKGTLTIESELDNVPIRIMQGDKVARQLTVTKSGNSVRVAEGTYVVELETKLDGMVVENDQVSLKRGATEHVVIRLSTKNGNATAGVSNQAEMARTDSVATFSAPDAEAKIIVDVYGGKHVLGQNNAKYGKLVQKLNAIDGVQVNYRESGSGNEIALVIVRDPTGLLNQEALSTGKPSARREAISNALARIPNVRWEEGGQISITPEDVSAAHGTLSPSNDARDEKAAKSNSSPEFPPVKILVHDEEGKPLSGVQVSLVQSPTNLGGQILEGSETSDEQGMAVNRNLPFGHYELSAKTKDGWNLTGNKNRINAEFGKGIDFILVAPTPVPVSKLTIRDDVKTQLASVSELRFGILEEVNGPAFLTTGAPEPEADLGDYGAFPTLTNGIEHVGVEIRFEIAKNISQPSRSASHLNTKWQWAPVDETNSSRRYLIVNGQARGFVNGFVFDDKALYLRPSDGSKLFNLPSEKHRVGASLIALRKATAIPLEIEIPAGEINIYVERFLGKPNAAAMEALNWQAQDNQEELWLEANVQRNSAWIERLVDTTGWIPTILKPGYTEIAGHLQMRKTLQAGETLEIWPVP